MDFIMQEKAMSSYDQVAPKEAKNQNPKNPPVRG